VRTRINREKKMSEELTVVINFLVFFMVVCSNFFWHKYVKMRQLAKAKRNIREYLKPEYAHLKAA
jgi:hypothetical protein